MTLMDPKNQNNGTTPHKPRYHVHQNKIILITSCKRRFNFRGHHISRNSVPPPDAANDQFEEHVLGKSNDAIQHDHPSMFSIQDDLTEDFYKHMFKTN